jgi:hypothetical protein
MKLLIDFVRQRRYSPRDRDGFRAIHPEDIESKPFAAFPPAARLAVLVGDPTQAGP